MSQQLISRNEPLKRLRDEERGLAGVNSIQDLMGLINKEIEKADEARRAVGPKIAIVHARGPIIDFNLGAGFASQFICRDDFIKVVDELRHEFTDDQNVWTLVRRRAAAAPA